VQCVPSKLEGSFHSSGAPASAMATTITSGAMLAFDMNQAPPLVHMYILEKIDQPRVGTY